MKKSKRNPGTIYAICLLVSVGVLGSCDLQQKDDPPKPFYRFMASGVGSVEVGFTDYPGPGSTLPDPYSGNGPTLLNGSGDEQGSWQQEMLEDKVIERQGEHSVALFEMASRPYDSPGPLAARIVYVDDKGNERILAENSTSGSYCEAVTPQLFYHEPNTTIGPAGPGPSLPGHSGCPPTKVICAELHRQRLMDETIFTADEAFGRYLRDHQRDVLLGYQLWARPVVRWMQKSKTVTKIVASAATPWSYEMAYRMGTRDEGSFAGKILMDVGVPVCRAIGRVVIWAGNRGLREDAGSHEDPCPGELAIPTN